MEEMVEKINAEEPDVVVIAGDIFDNEYDAIYEPDRVADLLAGLKSRYGTYACYGNHDLDEKILAGFTFETKEERVADRRFGEFLDRAKIHLLEDDVVCIDDAFYLAGRKDPDRIRKTQETRDTPSELLTGLDQSLPVFVIDHQPSELTELAEAGADLDLGGHTHDGQLFPGNILTGLMWENACGMKKVGDMYSIVTSGVGLWGPPMRIGTKAEVVIINYGK